MDAEKYLQQLDRVIAPPGFEQAVLARVNERKKTRVRLRRLGFSLAGATALILAGVIIFSPLLKKAPLETMADFPAEDQQGKLVKVIEHLDLRKEMRRAAGDYQTVFILEQVSDGWIQQISY